ncbi:CCHC-type domain-containing protein [Trichonephila clavipes]|nr:CCHC-type domain-containing protein [Trichonephila clavipes]
MLTKIARRLNPYTNRQPVRVQVTNQVYSLLEKELLVKNREDKLGNVVKLIVVPEELRDPIKSLCHEGTSAHLEYEIQRQIKTDIFNGRIAIKIWNDAGSEWTKSFVNSFSVTNCITKVQGIHRQSWCMGKKFTNPRDVRNGTLDGTGKKVISSLNICLRLINRLKRCQEVAINKMEEMQVKRKTWYDKNAVKRKFKDGDLVLVLATSRANKLAVQWIGPGTVLNKISELNYLVEIPGRRETSQIYHINMQKPYYKRPEHVNVIINDETKKLSQTRN